MNLWYKWFCYVISEPIADVKWGRTAFEKPLLKAVDARAQGAGREKVEDDVCPADQANIEDP